MVRHTTYFSDEIDDAISRYWTSDDSDERAKMFDIVMYEIIQSFEDDPNYTEAELDRMDFVSATWDYFDHRMNILK